MRYRAPLTALMLLAIALLPGSTARGQAPETLPAASWYTVVDPRVWEDTADGETAHFLVMLRSQADVQTVVAQAANWAERGRAVYSALRQAADASQPGITRQLDALGARYHAYYVVNALVVEGNRGVVEALALRPEVLAIESDRPFSVPAEPQGPANLTATDATSRQPGDAGSASAAEWNIAQVHAPDLWALGYTGQGMVYANADTGVQWDHPALKNQYRGWDGAAADHNYNWWDAVHDAIAPGGGSGPCGFSNGEPCDDRGHGTHTMGIAVGDDGAGNQIGVAPGARWIACRNMDRDWGRPSTYIECMQFFLAPWDLTGQNPDPDKRPDAVGNSYGCPVREGCTDQRALQAAVESLRAAGIFMAISAGNAGPACATVSDPPGLEPSAVTVGATDNSGAIASFSSRGPVTLSGGALRKPDLAAPGVNVLSSYLNYGYATLSGTSMAAPHVGGAVALLWSAHPRLRHNVDWTEWVLEQSATPRTTSQGCGGDGSDQVPNNVYGYGLLNVQAAHNLAADLPPLTSTLTIQGTVWLDVNRNGNHDAGEANVGGIKLLLLHDGQSLAEATSRADGTYAFLPVPAGFYDVRESIPASSATTPVEIHIETFLGRSQADVGHLPARLFLPVFLIP